MQNFCKKALIKEKGHLGEDSAGVLRDTGFRELQT